MKAWKKVTVEAENDRRPAARGARARAKDRPQLTYIMACDLRIGDEIIGTYVERIPDKKVGGFRHHIRTAKGPIVFLGTWDLDRKLGGVRPGDSVKILYQGRRYFEDAGEDEDAWCYQFEVFTQPAGGDGEEPEREYDGPNTREVDAEAPAHRPGSKRERGGSHE